MHAYRNMVASGLFAATMFVPLGLAVAGECPPDKVVADGRGQMPGATEPSGVKDTVLGSIDVASEPAAIDGRLFRLRRLALEPGGEVPWHSHDDRPAIIYVAIGQVTEYASDCAVPIVHHPGEVSVERSGRSHWWRNTGDSTAVLLSADLLRTEGGDDHVM
jgi:quercetin dioxygenase-like cupin family protein